MWIRRSLRWRSSPLGFTTRRSCAKSTAGKAACRRSSGLLADARDWDALRALFIDAVDVDYTSLNGGEPQTVPAADLIDGWRQVLENLEATHHLIAGRVVTIDGDQASCVANVQATHMLTNGTGDRLWTVGGRYDYRFERTRAGWRISALKLSVQWATGNRQIMELAAPRTPARER